jgi:hypothetical protein
MHQKNAKAQYYEEEGKKLLRPRDPVSLRLDFQVYVIFKKEL